MQNQLKMGHNFVLYNAELNETLGDIIMDGNDEVGRPNGEWIDIIDWCIQELRTADLVG